MSANEMLVAFIATIAAIFCFMLVGSIITEKQVMKSCYTYYEEMPHKDIGLLCRSITGIK